MTTVAKHETEIDAPAGVPWIDIVREFDASPAQVYRAHVDPDLLVRWLGPRDLEMTVDTWDPRSGGSWAYSHRRGEEVYAFFGSFHELREAARIVQTFTYAGSPDSVALEISIFEELPGGRTRLSSRSIGSSVEERDSMVSGGMEHGIVEGYQKLDELLADS
jgi:uncharacterized protein YndB with AHSA1/START domain